MRSSSLILLIALSVIVSVKCQAECGYGHTVYLEGEVVYVDLCNYCVCNSNGELDNCGTDANTCVESCPDGYYLQQDEDKCCPYCVAVDGEN